MGRAREVRTRPRQASDEVFALGSKEKATRYSQRLRRREGRRRTLELQEHVTTSCLVGQAGKRELFASIAQGVQSVTSHRDHKLMDTCKTNYRLPHNTSEQTAKIAEHQGAVITHSSSSQVSSSFLEPSHACAIRKLPIPENKSPYLSICSCRTPAQSTPAATKTSRLPLAKANLSHLKHPPPTPSREKQENRNHTTASAFASFVPFSTFNSSKIAVTPPPNPRPPSTSSTNSSALRVSPRRTRRVYANEPTDSM